VKLLRLFNDGYERKARLYPALVLGAPIVVTIIAIASLKLSAVQSIATVVIGCGGSFLLAQLARDAGKKREQGLFASWGGIPSVAILRHRDTRIDPITKARYHKKLGALVKGAKPPSFAEEQADFANADHIYQAWSTYIRVNTRDTKKYALLFNENVSYGYRRNLWGLRPWGIITSTLSCLIAAAWCVREYRTSADISIELLAATALALIFLVLWIFRFTSTWVRVPADAYAERLAEAVDTLAEKSAGTKDMKASSSSEKR
jgi:hypothetical protein